MLFIKDKKNITSIWIASTAMIVATFTVHECILLLTNIAIPIVTFAVIVVIGIILWIFETLVHGKYQQEKEAKGTCFIWSISLLISMLVVNAYSYALLHMNITFPVTTSAVIYIFAVILWTMKTLIQKKYQEQGS